MVSIIYTSICISRLYGKCSFRPIKYHTGPPEGVDLGQADISETPGQRPEWPHG